MEWFKHMSGASDDIKLKRLEYKLGITAYGVYFKTLEKVAKEGKNYRLDLEKFPLGFLSSEFKIEEDKLSEILTEMNDLGLVVLKVKEICVPTMEKYMDDWTKRKTRELRRNYGVDTEQLRKEEKRIDKIRREEQIPSHLIPYYDGMKVVTQNGKLFCIPNNGARWLEFTGKDKDIKWLPKK